MLVFAYQVLVWVFAAALVATTLLPLSESRAWWVRIWDFPRLHIAIGFAVLILLALPIGGPSAVMLIAVAFAGGIYQFRWILPYTRLGRIEARFAPDTPGGVTLLAVNVLKENESPERVLRLIEEIDADVVLLMETDARWDASLSPVLGHYPTILSEPHEDDHYGMIFATRLSAPEVKFLHLTRDETPSVLAELEAPGGRRFLFLGLHPQPPVPEGDDTDDRDAQIIYAARFARRADMPLIVMGDFNEAAWSRGSREFKRVGGYIDPRIGRGIFASFNANHMLIRCPIDQFFATTEVAVVRIELGRHVGSDHYPLIARIRIEPELASGLNTAPLPLDPDEVTRLDDLVAAYADGLAKARMSAEVGDPTIASRAGSASAS